MATGRMLRSQISISEQVNDLPIKAALLFTWMIPHADDWGRMCGSSRKVKALVVPMRDDITTKDIDKCLPEIEDAGLIARYELAGEIYIQFPKWEIHQTGLFKSTASKFPAPPNGEYCFSASEKDIEDFMCSAMEAGALFVNQHEITSHNRQVRIDNKYIDIVAILDDGNKVIFELKRQRISLSAINQAQNYARMIGGNPAVIVMGYGLAGNVTPSKQEVCLVTYDDNLQIKNENRTEDTGLKLLIDVISRQATSSNVTHRTEQKRTEQKRTEQKRTEGIKLEIPESLNTEEFLSTFEDFKKHREQKHQKMTEMQKIKLIKKLASYPLNVAIGSLNESITNGWLGVFPENSRNSGNGNQPVRDGKTADQLLYDYEEEKSRKFLEECAQKRKQQEEMHKEDKA